MRVTGGVGTVGRFVVELRVRVFSVEVDSVGRAFVGGRVDCAVGFTV